MSEYQVTTPASAVWPRSLHHGRGYTTGGPLFHKAVQRWTMVQDVLLTSVGPFSQSKQ
jgi:hypothetical protein